jgi:hypothetical protein
MYRLTALGCCIPAAFEQADVLISNQWSAFHQYAELLAQLTALEERFVEWRQHRLKKTSFGRAHENTADASSILRNQSTRRKAYSAIPTPDHGDSFLDALAHMNFCGLLLMLQKTILDVLVSLESAQPSSSHQHLSSLDMRSKCSETADLFMQNAPYVRSLSGPRGRAAKQGMIAFLIAIIVPWYCSNQDVGKVSWCRNLIEEFQEEHEDLDLVETVHNGWTTKPYIGWINMAF